MLLRNIGLSKEFILNDNKDNYKELLPASFFWRAFNRNLTTAEKVLNTNYLTLMRDCKLDPKFFGELTVLDSYYCYRGADSYATALCNVDKKNDIDLYTLMNELHKSYCKYNKTFFDEWHIRTSESVNATPTFIHYADHEHQVACHKHPIYTLVAMLPCYYLWYWFADKMCSEMSDDNIYKDWVKGCCYSDKTPMRIGNFIDKWQLDGKEFDEELAFAIYKKSMDYELEAFTNATKEGGEYEK